MARKVGAEAQLVAAAASLRGRSISMIRYCDVSAPTDDEWDHGVWHHAVIGVELIADNEPFTITWDNTVGWWYSAELSASPMTRHVRSIGEPDGVHVWEVTKHPRWATLIDQPISAVCLQWQEWHFVESDDPVRYPATTRLDFPGGSVWFFAAMPWRAEEPDVLLWPADEVVVSFDRSFVEGHGLPT